MEQVQPEITKVLPNVPEVIPPAPQSEAEVTKSSVVSPDATNVQIEPPAKKGPVVRHDFYQTDSAVVVTILTKNVNSQDVTVTFTETTLDLKAKLADGQDYELFLNLFSSIRPTGSTFIVTKSKIEIKLAKEAAGLWTALEAPNPQLVATRKVESKTKDWSKVEKAVAEELKGYDDGNPFAAFFDLADDDAKRAMMKSMQESHGTVLNMNWGEVSKKQIKPYESKDED